MLPQVSSDGVGPITLVGGSTGLSGGTAAVLGKMGALPQPTNITKNAVIAARRALEINNEFIKRIANDSRLLYHDDVAN